MSRIVGKPVNPPSSSQYKWVMRRADGGEIHTNRLGSLLKQQLPGDVLFAGGSYESRERKTTPEVEEYCAETAAFRILLRNAGIRVRSVRYFSGRSFYCWMRPDDVLRAVKIPGVSAEKYALESAKSDKKAGKMRCWTVYLEWRKQT